MQKKDFASMGRRTLLSSAEYHFIKVANRVYVTANKIISESPNALFDLHFNCNPHKHSRIKIYVNGSGASEVKRLKYPKSEG